MINEQWKRTVNDITSAVWMFTLGSIGAGIAGLVVFISDTQQMMENLVNTFSNGEGLESMLTFELTDHIEFFFLSIVVIGYYLFLSSVGKLARMQSNEADRQSLYQVRTAYIFLILSLLTDDIPLIGDLISLVFIIISYSKLLSAYSKLRHSLTLTNDARRGFENLHTAAILTLIGGILGCLPLVGAAVEGLFSFIAFFMLLMGWGAVKQGAPNMSADDIAAQVEERKLMKKKLPEPKLQGYWLMAMAVLPLISSFFAAIMYAVCEEDSSVLSVFEDVRNISHYFFIVALGIFMMVYRKANVRGWSLFALISLILIHVIESLFYRFCIPLIVEDIDNECILQLYDGVGIVFGLLIFLPLAIFILRSRLTTALKFWGVVLNLPFFWFVISHLVVVFQVNNHYESFNESSVVYYSLYATIRFCISMLILLFAVLNHKRANEDELETARLERNL